MTKACVMGQIENKTNPRGSKSYKTPHVVHLCCSMCCQIKYVHLKKHKFYIYGKKT